jgi:signal transduction histidine kinase
MTPYGEGSGFGLALCHRTVTALGGNLSVETGAGGTRVSMELPASGAAGMR